jgi:hypothetical protein
LLQQLGWERRLPPYSLTSLTSQVFAALADNAKHNQTGRTDEHGALRHRKVELCPVGAVAFLFFTHFHVLGSPVPSFEPDFTTEYGRHEWYEYHVFYTTSVRSEMTY